jgi:hypothetical protein
MNGRGKRYLGVSQTNSVDSKETHSGKAEVRRRAVNVRLISRQDDRKTFTKMLIQESGRYDDLWSKLNLSKNETISGLQVFHHSLVLKNG